jgi:hypothetical protein
MEANSQTPPSWPGPLRAAVGVAAVIAACLAAIIAYATNGILSTEESYSHETTLLIAQLIVATVGLLPAGLFARALIRWNATQAIVWLVLGVLVYLGWGVLNDAAVHGWANLKVF